MNESYWIDQQTGESIGPLYSWNDIRELQMQDDIRGMCRQKRIEYVEEPVILKDNNESI